MLTNELSVNLTWSTSHCVMVYYVEVTVTNTTSFTNTTTSQHITLTLQIGVVYSFRVRGADAINRIGQWSDPFVYPGKLVEIMHGREATVYLLVIILLVSLINNNCVFVVFYCFKLETLFIT